MDKPCLIRAARRADLAAVAALERAVFSDPWSEGSFLPLLDGQALVADADGVIVGYVFARVLVDDAEILNLAVHPEWQRRAIGRALMAAAVGEFKARHVRRVFLEVRVSNHAAQRFYRAAGFEPSGVRRNYYDSPREDALVLSLDIDRFQSSKENDKDGVSLVDKRT